MLLCLIYLRKQFSKGPYIGIYYGFSVSILVLTGLKVDLKYIIKIWRYAAKMYVLYRSSFDLKR